ncbi:MAG: alpha/beta hydrolase [Gemmatimonadota bacterium]
MTRTPLHHDRLPGDGVHLHVVRAGEGPPVVLLHGFPENWTTWLHQIDALVDAGFSVLAPDLRGYGASDRPRERDAYRIERLAADVAGVIRAAGAERATIVGHDWGGLIAWLVAGPYPELVGRLVILNAPHPRIFRRQVLRSSQALRSWYLLPAQIPIVAEAVLSAADFRVLRTMFRVMPVRPHAFSSARIDAFIDDLKRPGALTAALEYYRANRRLRGAVGGGVGRIDVPTLVLWGERDPALGTALLNGLDELVADLSIVRFADVGHWIQNEAPEEINREILRFLKG